MKKLPVIILLLSLLLNLHAKEYSVESPSGKITIKVSVDEAVKYTVLLNGNEIVSPSAISIELSDGTFWGKNAKVKKAKTISVSEEVIPVVKRKYAKIQNDCNQLTLSFNDYSLQFRAYDEGAAYRWISEKKDAYKVVNEQATFTFPADQKSGFPKKRACFLTRNANIYAKIFRI